MINAGPTMRRAWVLLLLWPLPVAIAMPARGDTTVYFRSGNWQAFSGTTPGNELVCGIRTEPGAGRDLSFEYLIGGSELTLTARSASWALPPGTTAQVSLQFNGGRVWQARSSGAGDRVTWSLPEEELARFDSAFRLGSTMTLIFAGNEPPWSVSLAGSNGASYTLGRCITEFSARRQERVQSARPGAG